MSQSGGIRVTVGEEGILVRFIASDGTEMSVEMLSLAEELDSDCARTIVQWCRDRVRDVTAHDLPADVREEVEDRIAGLASLIEVKATKQ
jgi:hypothetical protein